MSTKASALSPVSERRVFPWREEVRIAVVIPAYKVTERIREVVSRTPRWVYRIFVVDDACPQDSGSAAETMRDPRVVVLRHSENRGVGAATRTGFRAAVDAGCHIAVKIDGDGQMDPTMLETIVTPLLREEAALAKGNRFWHVQALREMPRIRLLGNVFLSFLLKMASGHWHVFDPTNGYLAIRTDVFQMLDQSHLSDRYFFESSLLIETGAYGFRVVDVPLPARYPGGESSLSIGHTIATFPWLVGLGGIRRFWCRHFWLDFTPVGLISMTGAPLILWGLAFGGYAWWKSISTGAPATAGTVMLAALPFLLGAVFLLQALAMEASGSFNGRIGVYDLRTILKKDKDRHPGSDGWLIERRDHSEP